MSLFNKLKIFLKRPGQYFRYKKKFLRNLYFQFSKYMHFKTYYSRVYKKRFSSYMLEKNDLIDKNEGYKLISFNKLKNNNIDINKLLEKSIMI